MFHEGMAITSTKPDVTAALRELSSLIDDPIVSVFVPVDFGQPQPERTIQRALRLAVHTASTQLAADHGLSARSSDAFLAPLLDEQLIESLPAGSRGLAVFVSRERDRHVALPVDVGSAVEIGDRPDLLRLLPMITDDAEFLCLLLDKKGAHLFRGSHFAFEPVTVPAMPGSIDDALWYIRREPVLTRNGNGMVYSSGGGQDLRKDDVRQFIHLIDQAIASTLNTSEAPLVVAGVEYEAAMFINSSKYRHVVATPIVGNPEAISRRDMHDRAWELAKSASRRTSDAMVEFGGLAGTGRTTTDLDELQLATAGGTVSRLIVARSTTTAMSGMTSEQRRHTVAAVNQALHHNTDISVVADADLPMGSRLAAVLRY
jgi:hypothetical protein